jgi:hypothetical protein
MVARRRLILKLEALTDDAVAHLEAQADLLLTMPEHRRVDRWPRRLDVLRPRPAMVRLPRTGSRRGR